MSFQAMALASHVRINPTKKLILMAMANYVDASNRLWPSYERLAIDTCLHPRTIMRHVKQMAEMGVLNVKNRTAKSGASTSNMYAWKLPKWMESEGYIIQFCANHGVKVLPPDAPFPPNEEIEVEDDTPFEPSVYRGDPLSGGGDRVSGGGDRVSPDPIKEPINLRSILSTDEKIEEPFEAPKSTSRAPVFAEDLTLDEQFKLAARKIRADKQCDLTREFEIFKGHHDGKLLGLPKWLSLWMRWDNNYRKQPKEKFDPLAAIAAW